MPELPEVETIRRGLVAKMLGAVIEKVEVTSPKQFIGDPRTLKGATIVDLTRRGKLLIFHFDDNRFMGVHLKMTGQLLWKGVEGDAVMGGHPAQSYIATLPNKHTRMQFFMEDGSILYFNDLRKFGFAELMGMKEFAANQFLRKLGPEPLSKDFTFAHLKKSVEKSGVAIKTLLLDQVKIAGLGNIYADESLFRAGIDPRRAGSSLDDDELQKLFVAIRETLELALEYGGSSERDYVNAIGEKGTYLKIANVYRRTGQPCTRCPDKEIKRIKLGGRSTHFCANCQH